MPRIVAFTAPSGSGKTTIARAVLAAIPDLRFSVSATTRAPREGERDGVHYHFVGEADFRKLIAEGRLVEYEEVYPGKLYGTLRSAVEDVDHPVLLDVEVLGALNVKRLYGSDALVVFIRPPSLEVLAERLRRRATETEESFAVRIERAREEMQYADRFDAVVVNDDLDAAIAEALRLVQDFLAR